MEQLNIDFRNRRLFMDGPKRRETLSIASRYPWEKWGGFPEMLFSSLGTMHLVAPYLPPVIKTEFGVPLPVHELISAMYLSEKRSPPLNWPLAKAARFPLPKPNPGRVAIAYSAGKDSMWNLWRATEKYGADNVLAVHIRNLNKNNGPDELKYVLRQQKEFGFRHLEVIELKNGSLNTGFRVMRSRDMFLAGLIIPVALEFGASKILTEGFYGAQADKVYFTGLESNMRYFNCFLSRMHIPVRVAWRNRNEMLVIRDLFENHPEWMPHVCNCFTIPVYKNAHRRAWQGGMPSFPLYDSQCGVCVKCKIVNLARVLYDPEARRIDRGDIRKFLALTDRWACVQRGKAAKGKPSSMDMLEGAFLRDLAKACGIYGVCAKSLE